MFLKYLRNDQRGVVFRLGTLMGVVGPGLVITIPVLDHVLVVDLDKAFPGWEGYGKEELKQKLISLVLDSPDGGERYGVKS
jgi:regulator of protease activity HflC (stomatin/prohibitin superfamily)